MNCTTFKPGLMNLLALSDSFESAMKVSRVSARGSPLITGQSIGISTRCITANKTDPTFLQVHPALCKVASSLRELSPDQTLLPLVKFWIVQITATTWSYDQRSDSQTA